MPNALDGAIESIARGIDPTRVFEEAARFLGDEEFVAKANVMHQEHIAAGQQILRNVGIPEGNFEAFESWVRRTDPELASTITRDMINKNARSLAQAGRSYMAARDSSLEQKLWAMNVETRRSDDGALHIAREAVGLEDIPARGDFGPNKWISVRDAERLGHLTVNE